MSDPGAAAGIGPAWLPLVLSVLALLISVGGLVWAVAKHFLFDGGRVRVTIRPALWDPSGGVVRTDSSNGSFRTDARRAVDSIMRLKGVECAELTVDNAGRTAVTIRSVGIAFRGQRPHGWRGRRLHLVAPGAFANPEGGEHYRKDHEPFRLEPYDRAVFLLDVHSVLEMARKTRPQDRRVVLRGFVDVPGTKRAALSPWRRRWRVPRRAATLQDFSRKVEAEFPIALIFARLSANDASTQTAMEFAARLVAAGLWAHRDVVDAKTRVAMAFDYDSYPIKLACGPSTALHQFYVRELLKSRGAQLSWKGAARQHELHLRALASREPDQREAQQSAVDDG